MFVKIETNWLHRYWEAPIQDLLEDLLEMFPTLPARTGKLAALYKMPTVMLGSHGGNADALAH